MMSFDSRKKSINELIFAGNWYRQLKVCFEVQSLEYQLLPDADWQPLQHVWQEHDETVSTTRGSLIQMQSYSPLLFPLQVLVIAVVSKEETRNEYNISIGVL